MSAEKNRFIAVLSAFGWVTLGLLLGGVAYKGCEPPSKTSLVYESINFGNLAMAKSGGGTRTGVTYKSKTNEKMSSKRGGLYTIIHNGTMRATKPGALLSHNLHKSLQDYLTKNAVLSATPSAYIRKAVAQTKPNYVVLTYYPKVDKSNTRGFANLHLWLFPNADETVVQVVAVLREQERYDDR